MLPTIMNRGPIDPWTRTPRSVAPSSTWAASHLRPSSAAFITTIAESSFQYTQGSSTGLSVTAAGSDRKSVMNGYTDIGTRRSISEGRRLNLNPLILVQGEQTLQYCSI